MQKSVAIRLFLGSFISVSPLTALAADAYKSVNLSLPIVSFDREAVTKFEYNLKGNGALGIELNTRSEAEVYSKSEIKEKNGDSLMMKSTELALMYSRYGNPKMMSGGFWGLGLGYRQMQIDWQETPGISQEGQVASLSGDNRLDHELTGSGMTAHARIGYRYVAESLPLSVGAYVGLRHFQNKLKDKDAEATQLDAEQLKSLERRFMSQLEPGIELGLAF